MHTLDQLYSNTLEGFISKEKKYIEKYKNKITDYEDKISKETNEDKITEYKNKIKKCTMKIKQYENKINIYFLENSDDLFQYFEIKKDIETNNNPKKLIHRFFDKSRKNEITSQTEYKHCIKTYMKKNNFDLF